jgi:hypothetical protein
MDIEDDDEIIALMPPPKDYLEQLDEISKIVVIVSNAAKLLDIDKSEDIKSLIQRIQIRYFLKSVIETNDSIDYCIRSGHYSTVEALSRISIEMSVNLMYVMGGKGNERSKGLIKHYLSKRKNNAKEWAAVAEENELKESKFAAEEIISLIDYRASTAEELIKPPIEGWLISSQKKFKSVGCEESYATLFASASDAIHSRSEDIFNLTSCIPFSPKVRSHMVKNIQFEKASFAVYLFICSAIFQYNSYISLCAKANLEQHQPEILLSLGEKLATLNLIHENDARASRRPPQ